MNSLSDFIILLQSTSLNSFSLSIECSHSHDDVHDTACCLIRDVGNK